MASHSGKGGNALKTPLDRFAYAIRHPLRRRILRALVGEPGSATTLARAFHLPVPEVSYHLNRVLDQQCGVLEMVDSVRIRGSVEKFYVVSREGVWLPMPGPELPASVERCGRSISLREFVALAVAALEAGAFDPPHGDVLTWTPAAVDDAGWEQIRSAARHFEDSVAAVLRRCGEESARGAIPRAELRSVVAGAAAFRAPAGTEPRLPWDERG